MSATNSTTNYQLPQFIQTDKPSWLGDFNGAMRDIDTQMKTNADGVAANAANITTLGSSVSTNTSDISTLNTNVSTLSSTVSTQGSDISSLQSSVSTLSEPITTARIDDGAVTSTKIADGTITTGDIADEAVTKQKIDIPSLAGSVVLADDITTVYKNDLSGSFATSESTFGSFTVGPGTWIFFLRGQIDFGSSNGTAIYIDLRDNSTTGGTLTAINQWGTGSPMVCSFSDAFTFTGNRTIYIRGKADAGGVNYLRLRALAVRIKA